MIPHEQLTEKIPAFNWFFSNRTKEDFSSLLEHGFNQAMLSETFRVHILNLSFYKPRSSIYNEFWFVFTVFQNFFDEGSGYKPISRWINFHKLVHFNVYS